MRNWLAPDGDRPKSTPLRIAGTLLDLGFAEFNVLLGDRIVFLLYHLLGLGAGILLGDVEIAGIGARQKLDLDHGRLGHRGSPRLSWGRAPQVARNLATKVKEVKETVRRNALRLLRPTQEAPAAACHAASGRMGPEDHG